MTITIRKTNQVNPIIHENCTVYTVRDGFYTVQEKTKTDVILHRYNILTIDSITETEPLNN